MAEIPFFAPNSSTDRARKRAGVLERFLSRGYVPGFQWAEAHAHWLLRLPLAALIWGYGIDKFPGAVVNPGDFGVPATLYVLNAFGEVLGTIALLLGGVVESLQPRTALARFGGDLLTRAAGFALGAAVAGVIVFFYWSTITLSNPHTMQLGIALYFALRGNGLLSATKRATAYA
ncbi:MAG: hypothetical protein AAF648_02705 [Pseudomonadota bacterium]